MGRLEKGQTLETGILHDDGFVRKVISEESSLRKRDNQRVSRVQGRPEKKKLEDREGEDLKTFVLNHLYSSSVTQYLGSRKRCRQYYDALGTLVSGPSTTSRHYPFVYSDESYSTLEDRLNYKVT